MLPLTLFFYGFLAGCAGLLSQVFFLVLFGKETDVLSPSLVFLVIAAVVEEAMRLLFLLQAWRRFGERSFSLPFLILFGLGFATVEIMFAIFLNPQNNLSIILLTANTLFHIGATLFLAFGLRRFSFSHPTLLIFLLSSIVAHSLYNIFRLTQ